ncbi:MULTISPECIES: ParB N-terminal domain-containing protein [unclassified Endozoicomonas]|uniref:ParB N-terminal domain-containing protein n=1 Tax=unclassified Endozoicomonas TaxID=2644528 RepID=UPI003BB5AD04
MKEQYEVINLEQLELDHHNPRLPTRLRIQPEEVVINWMLTDASLIELMLAIGNNGFFPGEPLLTIKEGDRYIVIEGNRRLASLKLLQDSTIANRHKKKVKTVIEETTERPTEIPCIIFSNRSEVNKYLGYRHVTGVKEWELLSKARYLNSLAEELEISNPIQLKKELAKAIGSKSDYVNRLLIGFELYSEIESNNFFNINDLTEEKFHFNYLLDSLRRSNISKFIGVNTRSENPLEEYHNIQAKHANFERLIKWFFDKSGRNRVAIRGDSDSLSKLDAVLADRIATEYLFRNEDLEESYEKLDKTYDSFNHNLAISKKHITNAMHQLPSIKEAYETDIETLSEIIKTAEIIKLTINAIENN